MEKTKDMFCKSDLLERGWSEKAIKELLPEPILKINPRYKKASPMKLWELDIVLEIEDTDEFIEFKTAKLVRSAKAKEVCEKRAEILVDEIKQCKVTVRLLEVSELENATINALNNRNLLKDKPYIVRKNIDDATMNRWLVNYIRHNLTEYDSFCDLLFNRVGKARGYEVLKNNVLLEISKIYPYLKDECTKQSI